jgi:hypothetical protein
MDLISFDDPISMFAYGILIGVIILFITVITYCTDQEDPADAGDLFLDELLDETKNPPEFRKFLIKRLASSSAFRSKAITALEKLHESYPWIYANVMRQDKKKIR